MEKEEQKNLEIQLFSLSKNMNFSSSKSLKFFPKLAQSPLSRWYVQNIWFEWVTWVLQIVPITLT